MGKRKQSIPQRATEDKRKCLSWNMQDGFDQGSISVVADNDPSLHQEALKADELLQSKHMAIDMTKDTSSFEKDDINDIFDLHVENSLFSFCVYREPCLKSSNWYCVLAEFNVQFSPGPLFLPLPSAIPDASVYSLYIGNEGEESIFSCINEQPTEKLTRKAGKFSKYVKRDIQFWLVDIALPFQCLQALQCRAFQVVLENFNAEEMIITMKVVGTEKILNKLGNPSEAVRIKGVNRSLKVLMEHFYRIVAPDYSELPFSRKHDLDALYSEIRHRHCSDARPILPQVQHEDLVPRLRFYQQAAITWMVYRETQQGMEGKEDLHMLYSEVTTRDGKTLYYNMHAGVFVRDRPMKLSWVPGGVLGDEMGLGKTVEVLGCILHHPRGVVPQPQPLPVVEDVEIQITKRKKRKRKKKLNYSEDSDSDTIIYSDITLSNVKDVAHDCEALSPSNKGASCDSKKQSNNSTLTDSSVSKIDDKKEETIKDRGLPNKITINGTANLNKDSQGYLLKNAATTEERKFDEIREYKSLLDSEATMKIENNDNEICKTYPVIMEETASPAVSGVDKVSKNSPNNKITETKVLSISNGNKKVSEGDSVDAGRNSVDTSPEKVEPSGLRTEFECVCGAMEATTRRRGKKRLHPVQCVTCGLWQHAECVNYDVKDPLRGEFKCPHCHINSPPVVSGATLIISPVSIAHQWVEEILKHMAKDSLNVFMYQGVNKQGFVQPQTLARQDIVITTYETLRKELDYVDLPHNNSDSGRKLRHPKRFMALPSPIVAVEWWRICLDEAQMVECTTTRTAEMAQRLTAVNRWCITGTPIQKGLDDLYGLLLFLGVDPYWVLQWWHNLVYDPFCHGVKEPMYDLLTSVLWRTVKKDVLDQIDIPAQTEHLQWLTFSPVEEHFYRRQYRDCVRLSMERLSKWTDSSMRLSSLDRHTVNQLLYPLVRLRQACCHPQAVRGEFLPIQKSTMTMEELLESLTKKARLEAEESHRALVASFNGQAGLHIIHEQYIEAVELYREVLRSVEEHKDRLQTDSLQQLHAMYNLREILQSHPEGIAPTLRDGQLDTQISELRDKYLAKAISYERSTWETLEPAQAEVKQLQREFDADSEWWLEIVHWSVMIVQDDALLLKVRHDIYDNREAGTVHLVKSCRSVRGLTYAIQTQLSALTNAHKAVLKALKKLMGPLTPDLINNTVECCLRPVDKELKTCPFCKSEELFEVYEAKLFFIQERGIMRAIDGSGFDVNVRKKGNWADSEMELALKSILSFARTYKAPEEHIEAGAAHLKLLDAMKKEYKRMRTHWAGIKEHVGAVDELEMCTTRLRLRLPEEPVPDTPQLHVLDRTELSQHKLKLASDRIVAQAELRKKLGQLLYLTNLAKSQDKTTGGDNPEPCPICQTEFGKEWSVMQCGHCYCLDCIRILVERASFGRRSFSVKCAICRQSTHSGEISYVTTKAKHEADDGEMRVLGSHSTKVEAIVRCLLKIKREDPRAKSLVFSTWTDVLSVIGRALEENHIQYKALYASGKFQQNLSAFKLDEDVTTLLLPVHSGANGLNLIEATNVLLVEPILNPAQELQAIGRVHRIGQSKPTHVYRFLVRGTIEQKMQVLLGSMDCPDTPGAGEESGLTIGDLSSLFTQQVEEEEIREGVQSPEDSDSPTSSGHTPRHAPHSPDSNGRNRQAENSAGDRTIVDLEVPGTSRVKSSGIQNCNIALEHSSDQGQTDRQIPSTSGLQGIQNTVYSSGDRTTDGLDEPEMSELRRSVQNTTSLCDHASYQGPTDFQMAETSGLRRSGNKKSLSSHLSHASWNQVDHDFESDSSGVGNRNTVVVGSKDGKILQKDNTCVQKRKQKGQASHTEGESQNLVQNDGEISEEISSVSTSPTLISRNSISTGATASSHSAGLSNSSTSPCSGHPSDCSVAVTCSSDLPCLSSSEQFSNHQYLPILDHNYVCKSHEI